VSDQVVVMGVAGTGKSTIAALVADHLGARLIEGDSYHPRSNIEKMAAGRPLTEEDRRPWLEQLAELLDGDRRQGRSTVLACSALRRAHRDTLRGGRPPSGLFLVHLHADVTVLEERMRHRHHFMPTSLLRSQLDVLEPLEEDERGVVIDVASDVESVMEQVRASLPGGTTRFH
jgi:gluconokinase